MTKMEELYKRKGEAHTQVEVWQQILKQVNQELSNELAKNPGGLNGEIVPKKNTNDSKVVETASYRDSCKPVSPKQ